MADEIERDNRWSALSCVTLQKFTNKKISIYLSDSSKRVGWVLAIDPVTHSVVVEETEHSTETSKKLTFVLGHSISRVVLEEDAESSKAPCRQLTDFIGDAKDTQYSHEELMKRKEDLMDWLSRNRVPVSEYSENSALLSVMGVLLVEPPYGPDCCRCSNEIVLDRVQKLIKAKQDHVSKEGNSSTEL